MYFFQFNIDVNYLACKKKFVQATSQNKEVYMLYCYTFVCILFVSLNDVRNKLAYVFKEPYLLLLN